jgi:5'-methylthioadenosine phosphorylase
LRFGRIGATEAVFLPRHGRGHRLSPSDINYRANIDVLKRAGVTDLVSVSACGSLRETLPPGTFVLVDQFVDRTRPRAEFVLRTRLRRACLDGPSRLPAACSSALAPAARGRTHIAHVVGGTYVCMEGRNSRRWLNRSDLSQAGLRRHRHDGDARGQARARGRDSATRRSRW